MGTQLVQFTISQKLEQSPCKANFLTAVLLFYCFTENQSILSVISYALVSLGATLASESTKCVN